MSMGSSRHIYQDPPSRVLGLIIYGIFMNRMCIFSYRDSCTLGQYVYRQTCKSGKNLLWALG